MLIGQHFICALTRVIPTLDVHLVNHSDGQQIKIPQGQPDLKTPEQEERSGHFSLGGPLFFLASTSTLRFSSQSSIILGNSW